jgi:hypothetical protein
VLDEGSLVTDSLGGAFQLPPSIKLTLGDETAAGQEFGAAFDIYKASRISGVDAEDCGAITAKKGWFEYSTSSNRGLGRGCENLLVSYAGLSEGSSTFAIPNTFANDPNSDICASYNESAELDLGSFNDHPFDDMMLSQDQTRSSFPQFVNNPASHMPSLISGSQKCGLLSPYNAAAHGFGRTATISQGCKSLESTTDDIPPYERPLPSWPLTGVTGIPDSFQYPLYGSTNLALFPPLSVVPPQLELSMANGKQ